ncbi:hypothetical protein [Microbulbifer celer]|uniref:DUF4430 domain-containing protein n=1 Tax=Microbulbifer celer TaxID=435905 RepID=A0ABW3UAK8_9GAMM|nr:hypothetical protein [Microbulbifer celer]UFN58593.1 hypothetical protein LPW13_05990 [Microbulbifer celer]
MKTVTATLLAIILSAFCSVATAAEFNVPKQLHAGFQAHRVSYSIKMSKVVTLGLQEVTGTARLYVGSSPTTLEQVAEIGFDYDLALGVSVGQEIGVTQQLYWEKINPQWYVLVETDGNADFEMVWQLEQAY